MTFKNRKGPCESLCGPGRSSGRKQFYCNLIPADRLWCQQITYYITMIDTDEPVLKRMQHINPAYLFPCINCIWWPLTLWSNVPIFHPEKWGYGTSIQKVGYGYPSYRKWRLWLCETCLSMMRKNYFHSHTVTLHCRWNLFYSVYTLRGVDHGGGRVCPPTFGQPPS